MTEMTEANVSLQALSALELCSEAFEDLESDDVGTRVGAVVALAGLVECSYGDEAEAVGAYVRESGGLEQLLECLGAAATVKTHAQRCVVRWAAQQLDATLPLGVHPLCGRNGLGVLSTHVSPETAQRRCHTAAIYAVAHHPATTT